MPEKVDPTKKEISESPVPEVLKTETVETKTTEKEEPVQTGPREEARRAVESQLSDVPEPETPETPEEKSEEKKEKKEEKESDDPVVRLKEKMHKRIGKEVAKRKSVEEENAELKAENERLKTERAKPEEKAEEKKVTESVKEKKEESDEPTDEEIAVALKKARTDGDTKFEVEILNYISEKNAKKVKDQTLKEINDRDAAVVAENERQTRDWQALVLDYAVYDKENKLDFSHQMNLGNKDSLLFKTASALYKDPDLQKALYNDKDKVAGFRRAVGDAYKEIVQGGLLKKTSKPSEKTEELETKPDASKRQKTALAEPAAEAPEEHDEPPAKAKVLTDEEKVVEEIKNRQKFHSERAPATR